VVSSNSRMPQWLVEIAIEPKRRGDQEKLGAALAKLAAEDPSFGISTDPESGQTVLKGMDELKLGIKVDILRRTCEVDTNLGSPQVAYRERVTRRAEVDYTHKKPRQYARVKFIVEPNEPARDLNSIAKSPVARSRRNISPASKRASTAC
jgi:elongation factor G